jgi:hypothetical protein
MPPLKFNPRNEMCTTHPNKFIRTPNVELPNGLRLRSTPSVASGKRRVRTPQEHRGRQVNYANLTVPQPGEPGSFSGLSRIRQRGVRRCKKLWLHLWLS